MFEGIDISHSYLDSSLCLIQSGISHDILSWISRVKGDSIQSWCTPFSIWNQSVDLWQVLSAASWLAYKFLMRQVTWSDISISLRIFYSLLWFTVRAFSIINEAEVDVFLEFPCFLYDPMNVGNLISDSSPFSKPTLYIWNPRFMYSWSLAWRILIITLLACKMSTIMQ